MDTRSAFLDGHAVEAIRVIAFARFRRGFS